MLRSDVFTKDRSNVFIALNTLYCRRWMTNNYLKYMNVTDTELISWLHLSRRDLQSHKVSGFTGISDALGALLSHHGDWMSKRILFHTRPILHDHGALMSNEGSCRHLDSCCCCYPSPFELLVLCSLRRLFVKGTSVRKVSTSPLLFLFDYLVFWRWFHP